VRIPLLSRRKTRNEPVLRSVRWTALLLCGALTACGGNVKGGDEDGEPSGAGGAGANGNGQGNGKGQIDLEPCEEGTELPSGFSEFCPWLGSDDLCYPTKEAACACLCRESSGQTCSSGFPGDETSRVPVSCF
jgi:hypothetical protein